MSKKSKGKKTAGENQWGKEVVKEDNRKPRNGPGGE